MRGFITYQNREQVGFFVIYILIFCQNENAQFDVLECAV